MRRLTENQSSSASLTKKKREREDPEAANEQEAPLPSTSDSPSSRKLPKTTSETEEKIRILKRKSTIYWLEGQRGMARASLEEAVMLLCDSTSSPPSSSSDPVKYEENFSTLIQLAEVCQELRDISAAIQYRNQALCLQLDCSDERWNLQAIKNLQVLAILYIQLQLNDKALDCYRTVYRMQHQHPLIDSQGKEVALTLSRLALLNYLLGNHSVALMFYQEELRLRLFHVSGDDFVNDDTARCLDAIAVSHVELGQISLAKLALIDSFRIRQALSEKDQQTDLQQDQDHRISYSMANTMVFLATVFLDLGDYDIALVCFEHALDMKQGNPEVVVDLQNFARALLEMGYFERASIYFRTALIALSQLKPLQITMYFPDLQTAIQKLIIINANLSMMLGDIESMMIFFEEYCRLNHNREDLDGLLIFGFTFYSVNRLHPPCAPVA